MGYVLIIGAKSDIAKATAQVYAKQGYDLYLAARNVNTLEGFASDLAIRRQRLVKTVELDILDYKNHQACYNQLSEKPIGVISFIGYLGNNVKAESEFEEAKLIIDTNYTGVVSLFNIIANDFEARGNGFIIGVSSVAGDRGRKNNYIYGSAKAALSTYLSGLRNKLYHAKVQVLTVKPGFVATKMTKEMDLPKILTAQPEEVAREIYRAQQKKKNVLYIKWMWKWIMLIIKSIPELQFKKMNI